MSIDLLVIGTGVAGCSAALQAADRGKLVTILTSEDDPLASNSFWAQVLCHYVGCCFGEGFSVKPKNSAFLCFLRLLLFHTCTLSRQLP